jgi:hypothetical protein
VPQFVPTDHVWSIFVVNDKFSLFWKLYKMNHRLSYSEDGSYTNNPHLKLSKNNKILAVNRGEVFTDAIDLEKGKFAMPYPKEFQNENQIKARSKKIEELLQE